MATVNPYLNFQGNTEEAFKFYSTVFGSEIQTIMRFGEMPGCDGSPISDDEKSKIGHIAMPLGNSILMGTDALESMGQTIRQGNNYYICYNPDSKEDADRIFNALAEGGKVEMAIADTFWGAYWGCVADKFGAQWMINYDTNTAGK